MDWFLEILTGNDSGKKMALERSPVLVGRDPARCAITVNDSNVSGIHASISFDNGAFYVEDKQSTNGTYVNGERISGMAHLSQTDTLTLGNSQMKLVKTNSLRSGQEASPGNLSSQEAVSIGRSPTNHFVIDQHSVSRTHAMMEFRNGGWVITDLQSAGGTTVNGTKVEGTATLSPGSWVGFSENHYYFDGKQFLDEKGSVVFLMPQKKEQTPALTHTISDIFSLPFTGSGGLKWLLGSILLIIPIVSFFVEGYRYRLYKNGISGSMDLPEWNEWGDLFAKGLQFFLVRLVYATAALLIVFLPPLLLIIGMNDATSGILLVSMIPGTLLYAGVEFIMPMCWAHFAATGSVVEAFRIRIILEKISMVFRPYLLSMLVLFGLLAIVSIFAVVPYIGILLALPGYFFAYIVTGLHFGNLYRRT